MKSDLLKLLLCSFVVVIVLNINVVLATTLSTTAGSGNAQQVTAAINELSSLSTSGNAQATATINQYNSLSSEQQETTKEELSNDNVASTVGGSFGATSTYNSGMGGRMSDVRTAALHIGSPAGPAGPGVANETMGWAFWAQGLSSWVDQNRRDRFNGYKYDTQGIIVGVDKQLGNWLVGFTTGYTDTDVKADVVDFKTEIDAFQLGLYSSYSFANLFIDAGISYSASNIDSRRKLSALNLTAKGDTDSDNYSYFISSGYNFTHGRWVITPNIGLQYVYSITDGYTETGAERNGAVWNQQFKKFDTDSFAGSVGTKVAFSLTKNLFAELRLSYEHEFINEDTKIKARLDIPGTQYREYKGLLPHDNTFTVGTGLSGSLNSNTSVYINYDYALKDDFESHSVMGGIRFSF